MKINKTQPVSLGWVILGLQLARLAKYKVYYASLFWIKNSISKTAAAQEFA